jgi:subtilisin family serine protease
MTLKVFDSSLKTVYNIQEAVKYAVDNGAKIINVSFGADDLGRFDKEFNKYFKYAYDNGAVLTVAAGNTLNYSRQNLDKYPSSPVCNDGDKNYVI